VGDFGGLQIGLSSLLAHRRAIDITGQNLANVNTDGYSRQRVELASSSGPVATAIHSRFEGAGQGVTSGQITRMRDQFLEVRAHQEYAASGRSNVLRSTFERIEGTFGEPSDDGLAAQMAEYWAAWDDVANRPDDLAARSQLLQRADTLAASFRRAQAALASQRAGTVEDLRNVVTEVNATASRIADLNRRIQSAVASGMNANDLLDQRDLLVGQLAQQVGATTRVGDTPGTVDVYVGGTALVRSSGAQQLAVTVGDPPAEEVSVAWASDGSTAPVSGSTGGMLDTVNDVLARYQADLAAVADTVRTDTNSLHQTGFDLDGNAGLPVFVMGSTGLQLNPALAGQPRLLAASNAAGTLDGSIARSLASSTGADTAYRQLVVGLGVEAQSANRRADIQGAITSQVDAARDSESGVSIDEEMTNLIAYQHAYDAAARFVSAIDEMLDTLINGTR
jgi:flagellar hook-associated protein 1 FlgK